MYGRAAIATLPYLIKPTEQRVIEVEPSENNEQTTETQQTEDAIAKKSHSSHKLNPDQKIVLDPTGLYDIPPDFISITTEVQWIKYFGVDSSKYYWVKGKRLCKWAEAWLRVWNKTHLIWEIKENISTKSAKPVEQKPVQRRPVLVLCSGGGKSKQRGELEITIDNPNSVPLTDLCLYIKELPSFETGKILEEKILANQRITIKLVIPEVPELSPTHQGNIISLSGKLTFKFASTEANSVSLAPDSAIAISQIFSSGFNIDEFL